MKTKAEIEARLAELRAANEAATGWGAAVGARSEEIRELEAALRRLAPANRRPIYGTDLSKPLSELMTGWRSNVAQIRGQMSDVAFAKSGWREELATLEGGLTCLLMAMHCSLERMQEHERRWAAEGLDRTVGDTLAGHKPRTESRTDLAVDLNPYSVKQDPSRD